MGCGYCVVPQSSPVYFGWSGRRQVEAIAYQRRWPHGPFLLFFPLLSLLPLLILFTATERRGPVTFPTGQSSSSQSNRGGAARPQGPRLSKSCDRFSTHLLTPWLVCEKQRSLCTLSLLVVLLPTSLSPRRLLLSCCCPSNTSAPHPSFRLPCDQDLL